MKTRYKIISILVILVVSFFVWPIPYNEICILNNHDSCGTISGLDIPGIGFLPYHSITTGNPNECWYQEDGGDMIPCMTDTNNALDTTICKNAVSNLVDVASRINPIPDVFRSMNISSIPEDMAIKMNLIPGDVITEELLKQKNEATLAVLNNCDVESLTMNEIGQLLAWGKENE